METRTLCDAVKAGDLAELQKRSLAIHEETGYPLHDVLLEKSLLLRAQPLHYGAELGHLDIVQARRCSLTTWHKDHLYISSFSNELLGRCGHQ